MQIVTYLSSVIHSNIPYQIADTPRFYYHTLIFFMALVFIFTRFSRRSSFGNDSGRDYMVFGTGLRGQIMTLC